MLEEKFYIYDANNTKLATYHKNTTGPAPFFSDMWVDERYLYGSERLATVMGRNVVAAGIVMYPAWDKVYELHDHLGNVRATFNWWHPAVIPPTIPVAYTSSYHHTYAFGAPQPNRYFESISAYHWGFNGQERKDDYKGIANHNHALYWEYDTRLGRRWNLDPKPQISISDYAVMGNSPIWQNDFLGDEKGDAVKKGDNEGAKGSRAPNMGVRNGDGSITGGYSSCLGCGANGEDTWGLPDEYSAFGSGDLNLLQAARLEIGKNVETRQMVENINNGVIAWMGIGAAAPVIAVVALETSPAWGPSLMNSFRNFNWGSAAADAAAQWVTKGDIRDVNPVSSIANGFIPNFLWSSFPGSFVDLSVNKIVESKEGKGTGILRSPKNVDVWISVLTNAAGNGMGGKLGSGMSQVPIFPYMSKWADPFGNFIGNIGGSGLEKAFEPEKPNEQTTHNE